MNRFQTALPVYDQSQARGRSFISSWLLSNVALGLKRHRLKTHCPKHSTKNNDTIRQNCNFMRASDDDGVKPVLRVIMLH